MPEFESSNTSQVSEPNSARLAHAIARLLVKRGESLAVVETSAGGRLSAALLAVPGASAWFRGGIIPYSAKGRALALGIESSGPSVSESSALNFARAARALFAADWCVAETGIAGPQVGRRSSKPAGLTCLAVVGPSLERTRILSLPDRGRRANMRAFGDAGLRFIADVLISAGAVDQGSD